MDHRPTLLLLIALLAAGCNLLAPPPPATPARVDLDFIPPGQVFPWTDENAVMSGICFEAAFDAAGRTYVLRSDAEHILFYDMADRAQLCLRPVVRHPFDFSDGRVLAGLWSRGGGCRARHDIIAYDRDDSARSIRLLLHFVTEGDCPYELVRPFWIGLEDARDYAISIMVQE